MTLKTPKMTWWDLLQTQRVQQFGKAQKGKLPRHCKQQEKDGKHAQTTLQDFFKQTKPLLIFNIYCFKLLYAKYHLYYLLHFIILITKMLKSHLMVPLSYQFHCRSFVAVHCCAEQEHPVSSFQRQCHLIYTLPTLYYLNYYGVMTHYSTSGASSCLTLFQKCSDSSLNLC